MEAYGCLGGGTITELSLRTEKNHGEPVRITVVPTDTRTPEYKVVSAVAKTTCLGKGKRRTKNAAAYCKVVSSELGPGCTKNSTRRTIHPSPPIIDSCHSTAILQPSTPDMNPEHSHEVARSYSM